MKINTIDISAGTLFVVSLIALFALLLLLCCIRFYRQEVAEEKERKTKPKIPSLTTYENEEVHRNCTVVVWSNSKNDERLIEWWDNDLEENKEAIETE